MMKFSFIQLLLAILFLPTVIFAQVNITEVDMPNIDDTIRISTSTTFLADPALTGTDFIWDFSDLISASQTVDTFVSVASTPVTYNWIFNNPILYPPAASIARANNKVPVSIPDNPFIPALEVTDTYDFLKETSSEFSKLGFASMFNGLPLPMKYDNPEVYYQFPVTYEDSYSSISFAEASIPTIGYYGQTVSRSSEVDGWGTLILPSGTYDAIRIKSVVNITDTLFVEQYSMGFPFSRPETIEYRWLTPGCKIPQLQIDVTNMATTATFQDPWVATGNNELLLGNKPAIQVWPNPAKGNLNISYSDSEKSDSRLKILTLGGKTVYSQNINNSVSTLDLKAIGISKGMYIISIETNDDIYYSKIVVE